MLVKVMVQQPFKYLALSDSSTHSFNPSRKTPHQHANTLTTR